MYYTLIDVEKTTFFYLSCVNHIPLVSVRQGAEELLTSLHLRSCLLDDKSFSLVRTRLSGR